MPKAKRRGTRQKKLAKLLYFADFDLYEKIQKSITGDVYCALPMGPVPSALEEITVDMAKRKCLALNKWKSARDTTRQRCTSILLNPTSLFLMKKKKDA